MLLIETQHDYSYYDETWTGKLQRRSTKRGQAPSKRWNCGACGGANDDPHLCVCRHGQARHGADGCDACGCTGFRPGELRRGTGWTVDKFSRRQPCSRCGGDVRDARPQNARGWIAEGGRWLKKGRGWYAIDGYTGEAVGSEQTAPTPVATRPIPCDACQAIGSRKDRRGSGTRPPTAAELAAGKTGYQRCERCDGTGLRDVAVMQLRLLEPAQRPTSVWIDQLDNYLRRLGVELSTLDRSRLRGLAAEERWLSSGSYREVSAALERLAYAWPGAHALIRAVVQEGTLGEAELRPDERRRFEGGLRLIDEMLPEHLHVPSVVLEAAEGRRTRLAGGQARSVAERNQQIRRLREEGKDIVFLMNAYRLGRRQIHSILAGAESATTSRSRG